MMTNRVALGSTDDMESCIVVGDTMASHTPEVNMPHHSLLPFELPWDDLFVPLDGLSRSTTALLRLAQPSTETLPRGNRLMRVYSRVEVDYQVCAARTGQRTIRPAFVGGRRQVSIPRANPVLPYTGGLRDCYVAWTDRSEYQVSNPTTVYGDDGLTLHLYKMAAGLLVYRTAVFDTTGKQHGYETCLMVMEPLHHLGPPDILRLTLYAHTFRHAEPRATYNMELPHFLLQGPHGDGWTDVLRRAMQGFERECSDSPASLQAQQRDWDDHAPTREAFNAWIIDRPWEDVIGQVTEAWQLLQLCRELQRSDVFPHRRSIYKKGRDMVQAYAKLSPGRAAEIARLWEEIKPQLQS